MTMALPTKPPRVRRNEPSTLLLRRTGKSYSLPWNIALVKTKPKDSVCWRKHLLLFTVLWVRKGFSFHCFLTLFHDVSCFCVYVYVHVYVWKPQRGRCGDRGRLGCKLQMCVI